MNGCIVNNKGTSSFKKIKKLKRVLHFFTALKCISQPFWACNAEWQISLPF